MDTETLRRGWGRRTRQVHCRLRTAKLISPTCLPHDFVAGGEKGDGDEGDEEGEGRGDMPPVEDYAEVGCVPGEEHLDEGGGECVTLGLEGEGRVRTFMLHMGLSMSIPPWPIEPWSTWL